MRKVPRFICFNRARHELRYSVCVSFSFSKVKKKDRNSFRIDRVRDRDRIKVERCGCLGARLMCRRATFSRRLGPLPPAYPCAGAWYRLPLYYCLLASTPVTLQQFISQLLCLQKKIFFFFEIKFWYF